MDKWMDEMLTKATVISKLDESDLWKRAEFMKLVDDIYIKGFSDGESTTKNVRITAESGKRFKVKRSELDFNSFNLLCHKLRVRLDAESIDFIGFDVHAYKHNGEEYQNIEGMKLKEEVHLCQAVSTLSM